MSAIRNIKIILAYDGFNYNGWQFQSGGQKTVQGVLENVLERILMHPVRVTAAGRTDSGVHAQGQVVNFFTENVIPCAGLQAALNALLPGDIAACDISEVSAKFHARSWAKSKCYCYIIDTSPILSPFHARYVLHETATLDIPAMQEAAKVLLGEHDFRAFMGAGSSVKTTVRTITRSEVTLKGGRLWYIIEGSGFLRHMVRNIVGTLLLVGQAELSPAKVAEILASLDRTKAGPTAPPQGLYLVRVDYE